MRPTGIRATGPRVSAGPDGDLGAGAERHTERNVAVVGIADPGCLVGVITTHRADVVGDDHVTGAQCGREQFEHVQGMLGRSVLLPRPERRFAG